MTLRYFREEGGAPYEIASFDLESTPTAIPKLGDSVKLYPDQGEPFFVASILWDYPMNEVRALCLDHQQAIKEIRRVQS